MRLAFLATLALMTAGCDVIEHPSGLIPRWTTAYRQVISDNDRIRLRDWRSSFERGLTPARKAGHSAETGREGPPPDPDAVPARAAMPHRCNRCLGGRATRKEPGNP